MEPFSFLLILKKHLQVIMSAERAFLEQLVELKGKTILCDPLQTPISKVCDDPCGADTIEEFEGMSQFDCTADSSGLLHNFPEKPTLSQLSAIVKKLFVDMYSQAPRGGNRETQERQSSVVESELLFKSGDEIQEIIKVSTESSLNDIRKELSAAQESCSQSKQEIVKINKSYVEIKEKLLIAESQLTSILKGANDSSSSLKEIKARILRMEATHAATACGCSTLQRSVSTHSTLLNILMNKQSITESILKLANPLHKETDPDICKRKQTKSNENFEQLAKATNQLQQQMHRRAQAEMEIFCDDEKRMSSLWCNYDTIKDLIRAGKVANSFPEIIETSDEQRAVDLSARPEFNLSLYNTDSNYCGYLPKQYKEFNFSTPAGDEDSSHTRSPSSSPRPPFDLSPDKDTAQSYTPKQHKKLSISEPAELSKEASTKILPSQGINKHSQGDVNDAWQTTSDVWETGGGATSWGGGGGSHKQSPLKTNTPPKTSTQWEKFTAPNIAPPVAERDDMSEASPLTFDSDDRPIDTESDDLPGY